MNKANQQLVVSTTNGFLASIRSIEIGYFTTFFGSFGTLSALFVGLVIQNLSQIPAQTAYEFNYAPKGWVIIYSICTAVAFCAAVHMTIVSGFLNVFGQHLALRGPPGSMVKAIDGLVSTLLR